MSTSKSKSITTPDRWLVASRVVAAALGGYALTSAATVVLSLLWPGPRAQAVLWATMISFTLYTLVVLWAFHTPSVKRVWIVILSATALLSAAAWLLGTGTQP